MTHRVLSKKYTMFKEALRHTSVKNFFLINTLENKNVHPVIQSHANFCIKNRYRFVCVDVMRIQATFVWIRNRLQVRIWILKQPFFSKTQLKIETQI